MKFLKPISLFLALFCLAAMLSACGNTGNPNDTTQGTSPAGESTSGDNKTYEAMDFTDPELDLSAYISLGQYKNVAITLSELEYLVEIRKLIVEDGAYFTKNTDRKVKEGDYINVDYTGKKNGIEFDGGKALDATLVAYENGTYIDGFADAFIGATPGEKSSFNVTFPENYSDSSLAGKEVTFEYTVNYIYEVDKLTDEIVNDLSDGEFKTVAEFETYHRQHVAQVPLWEQILKNATVISYPQQQVDYYFNNTKSTWMYYASQSGYSYAGFLALYGVTEEDFLEMARQYTLEDLAYHAIRRTENIVLEKEEYDAKLESYVKSYMEQIDCNRDYVMENLLDVVEDSMLYDKVQDFLVESANVTWQQPPQEETEGESQQESSALSTVLE